MALAAAVKGARHIGQTITFTDDDGTAVNLTGATLTGVIRSLASGATRAIDGTLALATPASGIFTWSYGAVDVGTVGKFEVQFTATISGNTVISYIHNWTVFEVMTV